MKKTLTLLSLVSILLVAVFLLFDGIKDQKTETKVTKTNKVKIDSETLVSSVEKNNHKEAAVPSKRLIASNQQMEKSDEAVNARPRQRKSIESERERRMESGNKFDQPDMFEKIQKMIRTREGQSAPTYQPNYKFTEFTKLKKASKFSKTVANLNWVERGPANVGGRTRGIVVDPDDATKNTWYVGSVGGGIWKTTDAGTTWRCLTDEILNLSTTALVQGLSNKNVFYAGTGEGFNNADAIGGSGIFKSTDRGETWTQLSATANNNFAYVNRLVIDPADENVVVAGTRAGIFKSIDGGATWVKKSSFGNIQHLIANPLNFKTLYAAANNKGVVKSFDAGETWFETDNKNLNGARMEIAIAPSDTSKLYLSSEVSTGSALFGTLDGGNSWTEAKESSGKVYDWLGGQGWYDNTIAVNPYDADLVYIGGIDIWKMQITAGAPITAISSTQKDSMEVKFSFVPGGLSFENGGVGTGDEYWKSSNLSSADLYNVELRFGPGKGQKAARFINTTQDYQNYVDVPFEAWDITGNRQLMVSFQDANKNGVFDVSSLSGDKIHFHNIAYNAAAPSDSVAKSNGIKYKNKELCITSESKFSCL